MAKYTPDDKYFKIPNNGLFIGINNAEVGKSYTFSIKPRFDIEKEVKLIIFLIPDLQAAVDNNLISIEFATGLSLAGLIPDPNNTNNYIPAPIQGQATAYAEIINLPTVNPKNNTNLSSSSDFDLNQRIITFNTSGIKQMQIIYPGETKYRTSSGKSVNSIDEYIDEVLITAENVYKINMYQISISTEADFAKFDLPENKVEFTQEQPKPEENTEDKKDNEPVTNTEKPVSKTGITFDVTKEGIFTNAEFGELKVVNPSLDGFDFGDDFEDLDLLSDEYKEEGFEGEESTLVDGNAVMLFNTAELERDEGGDFDSGVVNTGGNNINSPNSSVSTSSVTLPPDLKNVQNSNVITKQSLGNGKFRSINSDIVAPSGKKVNGSDIVRNINQFVQDVLGPFSTFLKTNYPSLYKSWYITSATRGYVPSGGSLTSQHLKGQAIDSQILGSRSNNPEKNIELLNAILEWYKSNPVGYGQILFETRGKSCWIHWSYSRSYNKLQLLRFKSDSTLRTAQVNTTGKYVLPPVSKGSLGFA